MTPFVITWCHIICKTVGILQLICVSFSKKRVWHLDGWISICHSLLQFSMVYRSSFRASGQSVLILPMNDKELPSGIPWEMSSTKIRKSIGRKTEPWGMLEVTGTSWYAWQSRTTFWLWPARKSLIHLAVLLWTPCQSGRSPKVVAIFSATNLSSYKIELPQLHNAIQIKLNYT